MIGFLGTGHITAAIVEGLSTVPDAPAIIVSPRSVPIARRLVARFPNVVVASDNQDVVERARTVFVALRPEHVESTVRALRFSPHHLVVTLVGTMARAEVAALVAPAVRVVRAGPIPSARRRKGPVPYFPGDDEAARLFAGFGKPLLVADERQFHLLWCLVSLIATHFALLEDASSWVVRQGAEAGSTRAFLGALFEALGAEGESGAFEALRGAAATPGGLNEQALAEFRARGGQTALTAALESVWSRLSLGLD